MKAKTKRKMLKKTGAFLEWDLSIGINCFFTRFKQKRQKIIISLCFLVNNIACINVNCFFGPSVVCILSSVFFWWRISMLMRSEERKSSRILKIEN